MVIVRLYRRPGLSRDATLGKLRLLKQVTPLVASLDTELCFNVELTEPLAEEDSEKLRWILSAVFEPDRLTAEPRLSGVARSSLMLEIGPRLNFSTAYSSNAVSICHSIGLTQVSRLEVSTRYLLGWQQQGLVLSPATEDRLLAVLHDRMTQCRYVKPVDSFLLAVTPEPWFQVDVLGKGRPALEEVNDRLGLAFDSWDLDFYTDLFRDRLHRNPTSVECFDLAQSNSEHSRHWFFKGKMVIDGQTQPDSLLDMIINTQTTSNQNNVIKFSDNSSAIEGFTVGQFRPRDTSTASPFTLSQSRSHLIFTAETHNFPTGVAPFSGATTGTGGRIRDIQGVGRGGNYIAGSAGYCVGNLLLPGYVLPWEDPKQPYPGNFARPLDILVEASNGASDYGNKFGEPLICGFVRSFGLVDMLGERREWIKPIMFSGGLGSMDANMVDKIKPEKGMKVVKLGGPVYRIGVGGGSASSVEVQGDNKTELDFGAVQRGDAEMEQKLNRVIRACVECAEDNPICSIHDQGAGGNGNVLKELVEPSGAVIFTRSFQLGDPTISTLELWGAEYQENDALLCRPEHRPLLEKMSRRERCPISVVGTVLDSGKVILSEDETMDDTKYLDGSYESEAALHPVNVELEMVLGKMPQKVFKLDRNPVIVKELSLPPRLTVLEALDRVLRLPSVSSKRYLTNKVDRCVTGLIAQQQCVGPLHTPLADVAVAAISLFNTEGIASSIGEQPIKGLINAAAGARMAVAEALSNLVFAKISDLRDVKCSGNWMWAAKLQGEGAALYEACTAMCEVMKQLGIAVDGGKDSLSMAARVGTDTVKAPGAIVVSAYAPCPDIRLCVTPDLKAPSLGRRGALLLVDLSGGKSRLGGSALAQCYQQLGDNTPDLDNPAMLKQAFIATQQLIQEEQVLAGHDVSDGGLITCLLEMCFAGISGMSAEVTHRTQGGPLEALFAEELGWVLEVLEEHKQHALDVFARHEVPCHDIGTSTGYGLQAQMTVKVNQTSVLDSDVLSLLRVWEATSYQLERLQANPECVEQEFRGIGKRKAPQYRLTFDPQQPLVPNPVTMSIRVAVLREEGTNGDREMAAALYKAGFQVWDVTMQDLLDKQVTVDHFRGIVFPGGFSYADVLGSAKGWAASLLFHPSLKQQLTAFYNRADTFSLGVCNGCQLMSLLGWVGRGVEGRPNIVLDHNKSGRFECRWSTVRIQRSNAVMLRGMEGSVLGIWVAHGEGRFTFREKSTLASLEAGNCCAIQYVDDDRKPTEEYPFNPNGSPGGLAGVCSQDGRHLAMMPHPERCTEMWQWPWMPTDWQQRDHKPASPWQRMFQNAHQWACDNSP